MNTTLSNFTFLVILVLLAGFSGKLGRIFGYLFLVFGNPLFPLPACWLVICFSHPAHPVFGSVAHVSVHKAITLA